MAGSAAAMRDTFAGAPRVVIGRAVSPAAAIPMPSLMYASRLCSALALRPVRRLSLLLLQHKNRARQNAL